MPVFQQAPTNSQNSAFEYLSQGFTDEAVALWEAFIKANPNPNQHHRVQRRLNTVKTQITH